MKQDQFSKALAQILMASGWHPGRQVDVTEVCRRIAEFGFVVSQPALEFMQEFYPLHFDRPNGPIDLDWEKTLRWLGESDIPFINQLTGTPLCVVGHGGRQLILVSAEGEFVFLNDEWVFYETFTNLTEAFLHLLSLGDCDRRIKYISLEQRPPGYED